MLAILKKWGESSFEFLPERFVQEDDKTDEHSNLLIFLSSQDLGNPPVIKSRDLVKEARVKYPDRGYILVSDRPLPSEPEFNEVTYCISEHLEILFLLYNLNGLQP